jgi:hypothetical protein
MGDEGTSDGLGRSAALFNNSHLADVVLAIGDLAPTPSAFVTTRAVAARLRISDSVVRPVMLRLEATQLLTRLPRLGPRAEQHYQRADTPTWFALVDLCGGLLGAVTRRDKATPPKHPK